MMNVNHTCIVFTFLWFFNLLLTSGAPLTDEQLNVSFLIVTHSQHVHHLRIALHSLNNAITLYSQENSAFRSEIHIVCVGKWDITTSETLRTVLRYSSAQLQRNQHIIRHPVLPNDDNRPFAYQINTVATKLATGDILVFLSSNLDVHEDFLRPMLSHFTEKLDSSKHEQFLSYLDHDSVDLWSFDEDFGVGIVSGKILTPEGLIYNAGNIFEMHKIFPRQLERWEIKGPESTVYQRYPHGLKEIIPAPTSGYEKQEEEESSQEDQTEYLVDDNRQQEHSGSDNNQIENENSQENNHNENNNDESNSDSNEDSYKNISSGDSESDKMKWDSVLDAVNEYFGEEVLTKSEENQSDSTSMAQIVSDIQNSTKTENNESDVKPEQNTQYTSIEDHIEAIRKAEQQIAFTEEPTTARRRFNLQTDFKIETTTDRHNTEIGQSDHSASTSNSNDEQQQQQQYENAPVLEMRYEYSVLPTARLAGESSDDKRLITDSHPLHHLLVVPSGDFTAIKKSVFKAVGGLSETYKQVNNGDATNTWLPFADLTALLVRAGWSSIVENESEAVYMHSEHVNKMELYQYDADSLFDMALFTARWGEYLFNRTVKPRYLFHDVDVVYEMECGTSGVLGFTVESINFVIGLEEWLSVIVRVPDVSLCVRALSEAGMPAYKLHALYRLSTKFDTLYLRDFIYFIHKDPGRYQHSVTRLGNFQAEPFYVIGRSMFETDLIPRNWVPASEEFADEIWVPSEFNRQSFMHSGINEMKLKVLPETIDLFAFDPSLPSRHLTYPEPLNAHPTQRNDDTVFTFLSVFKWEDRKGWKEVVAAFIQEFRTGEPVRLVIRSTLSPSNRGDLEAFIHQNELIYGEAASIIILPDLIPFWMMASLYKQADCVVSGSHGEGWGLPLMEAMAMEKPTIAVNWGGSTEFMNEQNSLLVNIVGLEDVDIQQEQHHWAKLDVSHLIPLMNFAYRENAAATALGVRARTDLFERFEQRAVCKKMALMFKEIADDKAAKKIAYQNRKQAYLPPPPPAPTPRKNYARGQTTVEKNGKIYVKMFELE